jgi:hypothetical protein
VTLIATMERRSTDRFMAMIFRSLPGLPPYGELPLRFSAHGGGTHSEGFVVEFQTGTDQKWVGNFARGANKFDWIDSHPNGRDALVVAGGQGYLIEPNLRIVISTFGGAIEGVLHYAPLQALVFNDQGLLFEALGPKGSLWKTRRISWDGMGDIRVSGSTLSGEAWDAVHDTWREFHVDLETGVVVGGAFPEILDR